MSMAEYVKEGERKALNLRNRGSIEFSSDGKLSQDIVDAYWEYGFYVFEGAIGAYELNDLQTDLERLLEHAPRTKDADVDSHGRPAFGLEFAKPTYRFSVPLSDPVGGTSANDGRHQVKMSEPTPPKDAPDYVISGIGGPLQVMDACLRLYGHPQLLAVTETIQGPDFTPFIESMIVKPAGLGRSIAWHQDGTTHWGSSDWDQGSHGFNFMAQFYGSTAANGVWVIPGSHKEGKLDIRQMVETNGGSDRLPDAIPMVCRPGDVVIANRQILHASFPNTSPDKRVTFNFGFHRRASVLGTEKIIRGEKLIYDEERIHERSRVVVLAIDARRQRFPEESCYVYQPLIGEEEHNRWSQVTRETILRDYTELDLGI
jgi:hypothetical protein